MKHISISIISIIISCMTVFIPVHIATIQDYSHVELGFPRYFVVQDKHLKYDPPASFFPTKVDFGSPWEDSSTIIFFSWKGFLLNVIVWFLIIQFITQGFLSFKK